MTDVKISLAAARVNSGMTQKEAASKVGVSKTTLINWEKNKTKIPFKALTELCNIYNFPIDGIFLP